MGVVALALVLPGVSAAQISISVTQQLQELSASDAAAGNAFGSAVALSGLTAFVGAPDRASDTGAAYVFTKPVAKWNQAFELTASDATAGDAFGTSVAVSGTTAVVGAPQRHSATGAVYVFTKSGTTWSQSAELTSTTAVPGDRFGASVSVSGATVVVGAPGADSGAGEVYVFTGSGGSWTQAALLTASDGAAGDAFGTSVDVSAGIAVVGAPGHSSDTGAAYIFSKPTSIWKQTAELTASDGAAGDAFGTSVAVSGTTAVVGAPDHDSNTGDAYVFTKGASTWTQSAELGAETSHDGDHFGRSVAMTSTSIVAGVSGAADAAGAAYVFTGSGSTWTQQAGLSASDGAPDDSLGMSVAISGTTVMAGASQRDDVEGVVDVFSASWGLDATLGANDGVSADQFGTSAAVSTSAALVGAPGRHSDTGAVYVFTKSAGAWSQHQELVASDGQSGDDFGAALSMSGPTALVGAPGKTGGAGAVYVLTKSGTTWSQSAELTASDGVSGDSFGSAVALSGSTAVIGAPDRDGSHGAVYVFTKSGSTWSQSAELTASDGATGDDFGSSVAVSGSTAAVGAPHHDTSTGAVYLFTGSGSSWTEHQELKSADGTSGDEFGQAVSMSSTTLVIGAIGYHSSTGAAYVFTKSGATWAQSGEMTPSDGVAGNQFGSAVAISGTTVAVIAVNPGALTSAAYVFVESGSSWPQTIEIFNTSGTTTDRLGYAVALSGSTELIGAINDDGTTGDGYLVTV